MKPSELNNAVHFLKLCGIMNLLRVLMVKRFCFLLLNDLARTCWILKGFKLNYMFSCRNDISASVVPQDMANDG